MAVVKLNVIGQAYTLRSLAAGAQTSYNLYAERIQDPAEQEKNKAFFYGRPGYHAFANTGGAAVRGIWTGAGRCFIAWDAHYAEFNSSGTQVGPTRNISNATVFGLANSPVQFFPNGNQLFIVSGGIAYVDNGAGPVAVTTNNSAGFVVAGGGSGNEVIWQSGDKFPTDGSWTGATIMINGHSNTIFHVLSDEFLLLTTTASDTGVQPYSKTGTAVLGVTGAFLDNTFFTNVASSRMVQFGSVNDSTGPLWNALDSITKDSWPDNILGILADSSQLYLFGTDSFEVWTANPSTSPTNNDFFVRIDGASGRVGNCSPWDMVSLDGRVYFLGRNAQGGISAYVMNGFTPVRISMHAQEQSWQAASLGTNAISWTLTFEGHSFWVIYFGAQTWVFDTTTGGWDRWVTGTGLSAFPFAYHSYIPEFGTGGMHLIGGPSSGIVYNMNPAFYDDAGANIWWQRALPHQYNARMRMYDSRLEVEMETGTAPSGTPTISLDYSDDRGHTFGTAETQPIGTTSDFSTRVYWTALGSYYDRVYRLSGQGQGRVAIIDIELDQDTGIV